MDSVSIIKWWLDVSGRTHMDYKGRSGYTMSLGKGDIFSLSKKYNLNTKCSTETELVGEDDALTQVLYSMYFT